MQTIPQRRAEHSNHWSTRIRSVSSKKFALPDQQERSRMGYWTMVVFSFLYYFRPGDIIPGIAPLHLAKVAAFFAIFALLLGANRLHSRKLPGEVKIILALFVWLAITIPFASWRGGSFAVVFIEFARIVIVVVTLVLTVTRFVELRRLILMQALGVSLMTFAALIVNNRMQGRLAGMGDGLLSNPNDLAMNIALNWPICLAFLLTGRGVIKKLFWATTMLVMIYALMATYSRGGFLALAVAILICLWDFGIRGRRAYLLGIAVLGLAGMLVLAPGNYVKRLETLFGKFQEGDYDRGSAEARKELLEKSLVITATHPVFGIGPGNFPSYTGLWRVTHNTYTQLSSECGIPALLLFLLLLRRAFLNLFYLRKMPRAPDKQEMHLYVSALSASFVAYLVGAFFSSSAYELFPYYMVIYTTLLYRLGFPEQGREAKRVLNPPVEVRQQAYSAI